MVAILLVIFSNVRLSEVSEVKIVRCAADMEGHAFGGTTILPLKDKNPPKKSY